MIKILGNIFAAAILTAAAVAQTAAPAIGDGNVWLEDKAGKHFTCPITGENSVVTEKTIYADWNGKRYYFCCPGCDVTFKKDPAAAVAKMVLPANVIAVSGEKLMVKCPVMGDTVAVNDKTPYRDYQGHRYYFCCNMCPPKFDKDSGKYALPSAQPDSSKMAPMKDMAPMKGMGSECKMPK